MKNFLFRIISITVILTMFLSCVSVFSLSASKDELGFDMETPFVRYEDEKGIRYIGTCDFPDGFSADSSSQSNIEIPDSKITVAKVGEGVNLPSAVDLSAEKYFPAVSNQGGLGSCGSFSTVYYQFSYEMNKSRDTAATAETTYSPNFVYNVINAMFDGGTLTQDNYTFLKQQGAPSIATLPYVEERVSWNAEEGIWEEAMDCRVDSFKRFEEVGNADTQITSADDPDLYEIKAALANGSVLNYSTFIYCWVSDKIKSHPDAPQNANFEGQEIVKYMDGSRGGHAMVIVGYNDEIWTDLNSNNAVDAGEMGAFKICNSWGDGYANDGFCWIAYDALNKVTAVEGGYQGARERIFDNICSITVKPYKQGSDIFVRFTMDTLDRTQMVVHFSVEYNGTVSAEKFLAGAGYNNSINNYSFAGTNEHNDGYFCYPLDNVAKDLNKDNFESYNFSATFSDSTEDSVELEVKKVELVNANTGEVYSVIDTPFTLDGSSKTVQIKAPTTDTKVIYYIGYDEPTVYYKAQGGEFVGVKMLANVESHGYNYKCVIENAPEDLELYFADDFGNIDNNQGSNYIASDRLNYFYTKGVRSPLAIDGFEYINGPTDVGRRVGFDPNVIGGYEPYNFQYTLENLETGDIYFIPYDSKYDKTYQINKTGKFKLTIEVTDQANDTASYTEVIEFVDRPFAFSQFKATSRYESLYFVGDAISFYAETEFEDIISRGPHKSIYEFVIKDSEGNICHSDKITTEVYNMYECISKISYEWIPDKKGDYVITVSSTDDNKEYAESSISFTVFDKICGDANGDSKVSIQDATAIQKYVALIEQNIFCLDVADCNGDEAVNIKDATCIGKYLALIDGYGDTGKVYEHTSPTPPVTDVTEPTTPAATEDVTPSGGVVTFTNSLRWGGTIYCYYWSNSDQSMTSWPGVAMTYAGQNQFGEDYYTFEVPASAGYIIFSNGSSQTADIVHGGAEKYYALTETDSNGHYKVALW